MIERPSDESIVELLHAAFQKPADQKKAEHTLLGTVGVIDSWIDDRVLLLGAGGGSDNLFHSIPLDLNVIAEGVRTMAVEALKDREAPKRPQDVSVAEWNAMDDFARGVTASDDACPRDASRREWSTMGPRGRAARAMRERIVESDFRGSLSEGRPCGVEPEDLAIVARVMSLISKDEMDALIRRGYQAAGPDGRTA
jgi:hypothetical protein